MLRALALLLIPLAVLATACGDSDDNNADRSEPAPSGTAESRVETAEPAEAFTPTPIPSSLGEAGDRALLGTLNPFQLLNNLGGAGLSTDVDPSLQAALLAPGDVPPDFASFGEFSFSVPSEYGTMDIAANMFASGDLEGGDFGAMVMSAALNLPPEALEEFSGELLRDLDLSDAELEELLAATETMGIGFSELRVLDASDLGDGGVGMHVVMDFGGLLSAFGAPEGETPLDDGLALDMYMFLVGERMSMVMVMWPAGGDAGVNTRELAEALAAK